MAYYSLKHGVGRGQRNDSMDVIVVQVLLKKHLYNVKTDGVYTEDLQTSIDTFQKEVEKLIIQTGTVTPGSNTLRQLELALGEPYELNSNKLLLAAEILEVIKPMGVRFYCNAQPNKKMTINSGRRTTASQASAMYIKLAQGDNIVALYVNKTAAKEIADAYAAGVKAKQSAAEITSAINAKLDNQVSRGVYISNHLSAKAFDVKSINLTASQQALVAKIGKEYCRTVIKETKPPHFHLELH